LKKFVFQLADLNSNELFERHMNNIRSSRC